ncbi:hypothetical protein BU24DRAFT_366814 [Aaosphaeria arxii CBS 175.79]|uniref:Rhodopsin domain-containing protein n=1 Tax=Aaosphaeria arxii CBS 175.79 TaxID=1450172 RepID=A0A6A5XW77_9PLEO|nr:uncharacterized protein BU24DRAFT_366814 [Aaosphaeria arxii CBS 175.79]KAF2017196.1 hypothetical protein BU24DRAFT_366814 [Aaosphaeria arxii CBS 175.79]
MVESRQTQALTVTVVFPVLAALFVAGRTYSRYLGQNFGWDDWLILLSFVLLIGQTITIYQFILLSGTGFHVYDLPKPTVAGQILAAKWSFAVQLFYHPLMGAIRASIIMFLFRVKDRRLLVRVALHIVFWINAGYMISTSIVNVFQCTPIRYAYLRAEMDHKDENGNRIAGGKCINSLVFILSSCSLSIFMDLIIIPIPTAMVWNLQMRFKTKMAVVVIMSMGWIATAVSVVRFVIYYYRFSPSNKDRTWDIGVVISIVEPAVGIIAACAPAMKRLFRHIMPRYFSDYNTSYQTRTQTYGKNTAPRPSLNYSNLPGMDGDPENTTYVATANGRIIAVSDKQDSYGLKRLNSVDSTAKIVGHPPSVTRERARSTKTGHTEYSEYEGALPQYPEHVLGYKS